MYSFQENVVLNAFFKQLHIIFFKEAQREKFWEIMTVILRAFTDTYALAVVFVEGNQNP